jgi:cytoskeleton protein RodZ
MTLSEWQHGDSIERFTGTPHSNMASVASELKAEREKRNIPLAKIAADTRISLRYLESLEEGRYSDLPGGMYNRAFLKAYCEILNLDLQEIMNRYEAEISPAFERQSKSRLQVHQDRSFKPSPVLIWSLMLLISACGVFFSRKWIANIFSPYFSHPQVAKVRYEPPPPPAQKPAPAETSEPSISAGITTGPVLPESSAQTAGSASETVVPSAASPASQPGVPAPKESTPAAAHVPALRLDMQVIEKCWISVSSDGHPITKKTFEPGETQSFDAADQLSIIVGNAAGVQLKINGKSVKPLGKAGEVIKLIINQKNLQEFVDQTAG